MIRPGKLHHAALRVADFERSRAFYEGLLGMSAVPRPDLGFPGAWYGLGDGQLHLMQCQKYGHGPIDPTEAHVAIEVEDYEATKATLRERGVEFLELGPQLWIRDPDGYTVELRQEGASARPGDLARGMRNRGKHWLFKTEPSTYSFAQLRAEGRTTWDGVKNPLALKHLASVADGDSVFIYHTGDEKAVVGVARAAGAPYPDPKVKDPKRLVVDLTPLRALAAPVSLATIKASKRFTGFDLVRLPRLSVMPVSEAQAAEIERMAKGGSIR